MTPHVDGTRSRLQARACYIAWHSRVLLAWVALMVATLGTFALVWRTWLA